MVSFQQQWEAAIAAQDTTRPRSPFRHAALLLAVALVLSTVPTIALARATDTHTHASVHCARVQGPVGEQVGQRVPDARCTTVPARWYRTPRPAPAAAIDRRAATPGAAIR